MRLDPAVAGIVLGLIIIAAIIYALSGPLERLEHKLAATTYGTTTLARNADGILVPAEQVAR